MRNNILKAVFLAVIFAGLAVQAAPDPTHAKLAKSTADHSKFEALNRTFASGPEVTKACLSCHTEASKQIHQTQHWKWEYVNPKTQQLLGKKHIVNNFCTSVKSNEGGCNSCHIGYGWKDVQSEFNAEENVDCLACHDATGKYKKPSGFAGLPVTKTPSFRLAPERSSGAST